MKEPQGKPRQHRPGKVFPGLLGEIPQWLLLAGMFFAAVVTWPIAPQELPIHWDIGGRPDLFGGKLVALFGLPVVALVVYLLVLAVTAFRDRSDSGGSPAARLLLTLRIGVLAVLAGEYARFQLDLRGQVIHGGLGGEAIAGVLLIAVGSQLGGLEPNKSVGLISPRTRSSPGIWRRTHKIGGRLLMALGAFALIAMLIRPSLGIVAIIIALLVFALWVGVYSNLKGNARQVDLSRNRVATGKRRADS